MLAKTPVPTSAIIISGMAPIGRSELGKFLIKSKFPGNDHTASKGAIPQMMRIKRMIPKAISPAFNLNISDTLLKLIGEKFTRKISNRQTGNLGKGV